MLKEIKLLKEHGFTSKVGSLTQPSIPKSPNKKKVIFFMGAQVLYKVKIYQTVI